MRNIISQDQAQDVNQVGGKAASLAKLDGFGFTPPPFFVISPDVFKQTKKGIITHKGFEKELNSALAKLGAGPFAVRSSARLEDGQEHSHAGQYDTVLNVSKNGVLDAAKQVWFSGFSKTVQTYQSLKTGAPAEAPAIIVQQMINATSAGVAFSADPVSGRRDHIIISAILGLGERLVSGEEDGESWVINHASEIISSPATPKVLTKDQARMVAKLAQECEQAFNIAQDIEWAFEGDKLHILQARPITTKLLAKAIPDNVLTIFDNSNIVESYPGMVSPLTYSFAVHIYSRVYRAFVDLLGVKPKVVEENSTIFDNMLGRIDGRVYYNLVNWYRALALLPGFSLNRSYMETMMGVSQPLQKEVTETIGPPPSVGFQKVLEYGKLFKVGSGLVLQAIRLPYTRKKFYERLNSSLDSNFDPNQANSTELVKEYRNLQTTLLDKWDAPLVNDFFCMIAFGASRNLLERWLGENGLQLHNDLMIGQGDIISAEPAQRIARMGQLVKQAGIADAIRSSGIKAIEPHPEILIELNQYLDKFGDRCTEELKLESIPLTKDPTSLLYAIASSADRDKRYVNEQVAIDWKEHFPTQPIKRTIAKSLLTWTKSRVRDRENLRFERTRIFGHARRVFLALGREFAARGIIKTDRDIFHLTIDEILGAVEGSGLTSNLKALIALRKTEDQQSAEKPDPPERIDIRGPAIVNRQHHKTTSRLDMSSRQTATGCSKGIVKAKACVIKNPRTETLPPGDILVARHTDPGWIAIFSNASAIVVERGSLLSHSAIVARELGIPCVVGLKGATEWIKNGELLEVNGATGEVIKRGD